MAESFQDEIIRSNVRNLTFLDMGGLWGTTNEKITVAAHAGAKSLAMADMQPEGNELWTTFRKHAAGLGVREDRYDTYPDQNLDDIDLSRKIGVYDFVHCSGVLYHVPNPMFTIGRLHSITRKYLLIGSMVVPDHIDTPVGHLSFTGGRMIHIPSINQETKEILKSFFDSRGLKLANINAEYSEPYCVNGKANYSPWWWLYNNDTLRQMLCISGFRILDQRDVWDGRASYFFCERAA